MEKKNSIFSALNPAPPPAQFPKAPEFPPASARTGPENDAKITGLQTAVKALQAEIAVLKEAASRPSAPTPPPPPPPPKPDPQFMSRLESSEAGLADLKANLAAYQALVKKRLETPASKDEVESVSFSVAEALSQFEAARRSLSEYTEEFSGIEQECRKSLGEMRGHIRNISQKLVADRFDAHLKESVSRLDARLAELEKAMYAGLADLAGRLISNEALYGKILAAAEERLKKVLEPDLEAVNGRLRGMSEKITWLMDEHNIVMERRLRALEAKSSAFDAISVRLDTLSGDREVKGKG
jgi:hypothetical protein